MASKKCDDESRTSSTAPLTSAYSYHSAGHLAQAEALYRSVLAAQPENSDAMQLLALLMVQTGRQESAINLFRDAVALRPDVADLHYNLARALQETGQFDAAAASYRDAVTLRPNFGEALVNLADVLLQLGERDEAVACCERALAFNPDFADAHNNLANAWCDRGELTKAVAGYERALALNPKFVEAHNNLGAVFQEQRRPLAAIGCYRRALELRPDYADASHNLGNALWEAGQLDEAIEAYRRATQIDPAHVSALAQMVHLKAHLCDWHDADAEAAQVLALMRRHPGKVPPFNLLEQGATPADQLLCARQYSHRLAKKRHVRLDLQRPRRHQKIRLGYLSADFRDHPVAYAMIETIERHDRTRFEAIGYSYGPDDDSAVRRQFAATFDRFRDLRAFGDDAAAEAIARDEVDILVDLTGYTRYGRPGILIPRPAPIQVSFLGYAGTMGADFVDYIIVDPFVVPTSEQPFFSEKLVQLAGCWWPAALHPGIPAQLPSREDRGLPKDAFVFCCFNRTSKLSAQVFSIWMRLLQSIPHSVLWLCADTRSTTEGNLRREAAQRGIAPARLIFAERAPLPEYVARHHLADLFLDTLPYNACTTAYYALLGGLPVLTCVGNTFAGRIGSSLLRAVGLPELITTSLAAYEELALCLAQSSNILRHMREKLTCSQSSAQLFDRDRFARDSEAAFIQMQEIRCAGKAPRSFSLSSVE